jgi:Cu(I)/Ag(I) efflux system membrane fusion protein
VRAAVNPLAQAHDLRAVREAFGGLSEAIIAFVGDTLNDDLAVAYCPMAHKSWLQRGQTIRNPYFGKAMADCGRIVRPNPAP